MEERQIALNDVIVACREAADHYRDNVDLVEGSRAADLFEQLAREHESISDDLGEHIRRLGALPREPDADSEQAQQLFSRFKAQLSFDELRTIVEERFQAETRIEKLITAALAHQLPDSTARRLEEATTSVSEAQRRLAELKGGL